MVTEEESRRRYVEGAIISALRLYRHWRKRGLTKSEAFKRSVKQALGMMEVSGLSREEVVDILEDFRRILDEIKNELTNQALNYKNEKPEVSSR
ncbi:MAG: hypothetical protein QN229_04700 [Desulfurococcaceae archaeon TW002]